MEHTRGGDTWDERGHRPRGWDWGLPWDHVGVMVFLLGGGNRDHQAFNGGAPAPAAV